MVTLLIALGTTFALMGLAIRLAVKKPCSLCLEGVAPAWGGWGERIHKHPRTGKMVWCGSCNPYEFEREVIQERT